MSATDYIEQDRRRMILAALSLQAGYTLAIRALKSPLQTAGYSATADRLRTDCTWLAEQGLAEVDLAADVVRLTDRGLEVALGDATTPGVGRPTPGQVDSLKGALTSTGVALARALSGSN